MVQRSSDLLADSQFAHRSFFRRLTHPEMGEVRYEGHQFCIRGYDNGPLAAAPCLGEHSVQVLQTCSASATRTWRASRPAAR